MATVIKHNVPKWVVALQGGHNNQTNVPKWWPYEVATIIKHNVPKWWPYEVATIIKHNYLTKVEVATIVKHNYFLTKVVAKRGREMGFYVSPSPTWEPGSSVWLAVARESTVVPLLPSVPSTGDQSPSYHWGRWASTCL